MASMDMTAPLVMAHETSDTLIVKHWAAAIIDAMLMFTVNGPSKVTFTNDTLTHRGSIKKGAVSVVLATSQIVRNDTCGMGSTGRHRLPYPPGKQAHDPLK